MIVGGFSCMFTPLLTFMQTGYFVVIMIVAFGIVSIIRAISSKNFGINFIFGILSVILGIVMLVFPQSLLFAENIMLILTAIWFVLMGIVNIVTSISVTKATGSGIWILQLILGILAVLLGIYSFFQPVLMALSLGALIGIFFIETGFTLLFAGIAIRE